MFDSVLIRCMGMLRVMVSRQTGIRLVCKIVAIYTAIARWSLIGVVD